MSKAERLSVMDCVFLFGDNKRMATEVANATVMDAPIDFEGYLAWLEPRLKWAPRLRQVLKTTPFHLRRPHWEEAPSFDIRDHVMESTLPAPGTDEQLKAYLTERFHVRMDRDKPLWQIEIVNGLQGDKSAMVFFMHHCLTDGAGAIEQLTKVLNDEPEGGWPRHVQYATAKESTPKRPWLPIRMLRTLVYPKPRAQLRALLAYFVAPGPWFPFTAPVSGRVNFAWREWPDTEFRTVSKALGAKVTDIVLAVLGGALDRYSKDNNIDVKGKYFKVALSANVRARDKYGELGNEITALPTLVPLGIEDAAERVNLIAEKSRYAKEIQLAEFTHGVFIGLGTLLTTPGMALVLRAINSKHWLRIANKIAPTPREHTITTSVLFPNITLTTYGRVPEQSYLMLPCAANMGIMCSAITGGGFLRLGISGDTETIPNVEESLMRHAEAAFDELREIAKERAGNVYPFVGTAAASDVAVGANAKRSQL